MSHPSPPKLDRRQRRTRRLLSAALLALIQEQGFANITIQAIADRADLNRATFYLHYGSKEELLIDTLERQFDLLVEEIENSTEIQDFWDGDIVAFRHVYENQALYRALFSDVSAGYIAFRIIDYIAEVTTQQLKAEIFPGSDPEIPIEVISRHVAGSLFSLLIWWLRNDFPKSAEEMAGYVQHMCLSGTMEILIDAGIKPSI